MSPPRLWVCARLKYFFEFSLWTIFCLTWSRAERPGSSSQSPPPSPTWQTRQIRQETDETGDRFISPRYFTALKTDFFFYKSVEASYYFVFWPVIVLGVAPGKVEYHNKTQRKVTINILNDYQLTFEIWKLIWNVDVYFKSFKNIQSWSCRICQDQPLIIPFRLNWKNIFWRDRTDDM